MVGIAPPDDSTASAMLPAPKPVGTPGYFTDGSLTTAATIVDCDFLNGLLVEMQTLAAAGGIPLSKASPTMTANIIALIVFELSGYVRKIGDTMTGNLILGTNYAGNNAATALAINNGTAGLNVVASSTAANINAAVVQAGDTLLWYSQGTANTGALTLAPYGSGTTGGLRMDATGQATFNRPITLSGGGTTTTSAVNTNSTAIATTAYVVGQAATTAPLFNGTAATGSSLLYARQDHVHPFMTMSGQCRLSVASSTSLVLSPYNGRWIVINGLPYVIPQAGISIANTGLVAGTLYYVYVYNNSGTLTLEISLTGHTTDTTTLNYGTEIKSGDSTRTLVGMIGMGAGSPGTFVDNTGQRYCANWFNRAKRDCYIFCNGGSVSSVGLVEISSGCRVQFVAFAGEMVDMSASGYAANSTDYQGITTCIALDGAAAGPASIATSAPAAPAIPGGNQNIATRNISTGIAEGGHTVSLFGASYTGSTASTAVWVVVTLVAIG
jgi:hypothetical protein